MFFIIFAAVAALLALGFKAAPRLTVLSQAIASAQAEGTDAGALQARFARLSALTGILLLLIFVGAHVLAGLI